MPRHVRHHTILCAQVAAVRAVLPLTYTAVQHDDNVRVSGCDCTRRGYTLERILRAYYLGQQS